MTNRFSIQPSHFRHCEGAWIVNGQDRYNCTYEDIPIEDLTKPCYYFARELKFQKQLGMKLGLWANKTRYYLRDINDLSQKTKAAIEINFKESLS